MSWTDINLADVSTQMDVLPEKEYVFEIMSGAKVNQFDANKIDARARVADGEYAGRQVFFAYPDPAKQEWSPRVFKRLVESLAASNAEHNIEAGEDPIAYLNRVAGAKFIAAVKHRMKEVEGSPKPVPKAELNIFSPKPLPTEAA